MLCGVKQRSENRRFLNWASTGAIESTNAPFAKVQNGRTGHEISKSQLAWKNFNISAQDAATSAVMSF